MNKNKGGQNRRKMIRPIIAPAQLIEHKYGSFWALCETKKNLILHTREDSPL